MQKKSIVFVLLLLMFVTFAAGCGVKRNRITDGSEVYVKRQPADTQEEPEEEEEIQEQVEDIYAVTAIDAERQILTLRDCHNAVEIPCEYTGGTYIRDKYGKNLTVDQLSLGELVQVERKGETLSAVQISEDAFSYDDLHNFVLDEEVQSLTVGSSIYNYDDSLLVYYDGSRIPLSELSEQDTVCIKGLGQQIYTLRVTNGHGIVALENVELFLGGYVTIGNMISQKITPRMRIEVAEGTHLISVANDGYGGGREITVEANKETQVDLNELKGEGPKICQMEFALTPENAEVFLDGEQVDTSQQIQVRYGTHSLKATAEGYADWTRTVIVNSALAKITIEMTTVEEEQQDESISTSNTNNNNNNNNNNNSNNNNTNNNNNNNTNNNNNNNSNNNNNNNNNNNTNNNNSNNNNSNNNSNNNNTNSNNNNSNTNNNNNNYTNSDINSFLDYIKKWITDTTNNNNTTNNNTQNNTNKNHDREDHDVSDHDRNNTRND